MACDHYHRYREDVALMKRLGLQVYRFSVAWPRVLPQGRGTANSLGLDFYDRLIDELLQNGIEPWLCLYHWDLPQALDDLGGWQNRDIAGWFADYTALVARRYGDRVRHFATFNEPNVCTLFGYGTGWNAPGIADRRSFLQAAHHVNLAHGDRSAPSGRRCRGPFSAPSTIGSSVCRSAPRRKTQWRPISWTPAGTGSTRTRKSSPNIRRSWPKACRNSCRRAIWRASPSRSTGSA